MRKPLALLALVIALVLVNLNIWHKEQHLAQGRLVLLELAPVDPRSLMQGDYMMLRFVIEDALYHALPKQDDSQQRLAVMVEDGAMVVRVDEHAVAHFVARYKGQSIHADQLLLRYRVRQGRVKFATRSFFFQEGHRRFYERARYGAFRVNQDGEMLLADLYDRHYQVIKPPRELIDSE